MARLQELLSQSVTQNLGLSDLLRKRDIEAQQLGQVQQLEGEKEAANVRASARKQRGALETLGALAGATGGFVFGGPQGAAAGAKIGQAVGGAASGKKATQQGSATANFISEGLKTASEFQKKDLDTEEKKARIQLTQAQTQKILTSKTERDSFENLLGKDKYTTPSIKKAIKDNDFSSLELKSESINKMGFSPSEIKSVTDLKETLKKDPTFKSSQDQLFKVKNAKELLSIGNPISDAAAQTSVARLFEKGVMTDQDVNRLGGSRAVAAFLDQFLERAKDGKLTEENREFMGSIVDSMQNTANENLTNVLNVELESFEALQGIDSDRLRPVFDPFTGSEKIEVKKNTGQDRKVKRDKSVSKEDIKQAKKFIKDFPGDPKVESLKARLRELGEVI